MKRRTSDFFVAPLILLLLGPFVQASAQTSTPVVGDAELRAAIRKFSTRSDSIDSPSGIPLHTWYHLAFKEVVGDASLWASLNLDDQALISIMPAPTDQQFLQLDQRELAEICARADPGIPTAPDVEVLAAAFEYSRLRRDRTLDEHYQNTTASLSAPTQKLIHELIQEFQVSRHVAHATFDIVGLAGEFPHEALALIRQGCIVFQAQMERYTP